MAECNDLSHHQLSGLYEHNNNDYDMDAVSDYGNCVADGGHAVVDYIDNYYDGNDKGAGVAAGNNDDLHQRKHYLTNTLTKKDSPGC